MLMLMVMVMMPTTLCVIMLLFMFVLPLFYMFMPMLASLPMYMLMLLLLPFFCPFIHVFHDELHRLIGDHLVNPAALLLHDLLDVDLLVSEPAEVVGDQVQVVAALAPDEHHARLVGVLGELAPLAVVAHGAGEHHEEGSFLGEQLGAFDVCIAN